MQIFLLYLFLFIVGAFFGWVLEVFFRRFFSAKKWVNPGFMKGPWLPLYGFGVIVMFTMCYLCISFLPSSMHFYNPLGGLFGQEYISGPVPTDLLPIGLMWIGMVSLEFVAGLIFIKGFHVKLWDYTNMKGNVLGIICPVFNVIWLAIAIIFYYAINPFLYVLSTNVHTYMFGSDGVGAHFGFIFGLGVFYGLMLWDFSSSVGLFARVSKFSRESGILDLYENAKAKWEAAVTEGKTAVLSKLPKPNEKVKKTVDETKTVIKTKIEEKIYIDPEKEKNNKDNYDENGRPIKIE